MIKASNILVYVLFFLIIAGTLGSRFVRSPPSELGTTPEVRLLDLNGPDKSANALRIFDARLAQYHSIASDIKTILYGMVIIAAISIYTTIAQPTQFDFPFLGFKADAIWLRWACPAILAYLWLNFGFALESSIVSRNFLLDLGHAIEINFDPIVAAKEPLRYSVEDGGFGDLIFYLFSSRYASDRNLGAVTFDWIILLSLYGTLFGVVHGTVFAGLLSWMRVTSRKALALGYFLIISVLMVGSHLVFARFVPFLWLMECYVAAIGAATFFMLPTDSKEFSNSRLMRRCGQLGISYDDAIAFPYFSSQGLQQRPLHIEYREGVENTVDWGSQKRPISKNDTTPHNLSEMKKLLETSFKS